MHRAVHQMCPKCRDEGFEGRRKDIGQMIHPEILQLSTQIVMNYQFLYTSQSLCKMYNPVQHNSPAITPNCVTEVLICLCGHVGASLLCC